MALSRFREIVNLKLVNYFNYKIVPDSDSPFNKPISTADQLNDLQSAFLYHTPDMLKVWNAVKEAETLDQAIKSVMVMHSHLAQHEPSPTTYHRFNQILSKYLYEILHDRIKDDICSNDKNQKFANTSKNIITI